MAVSLAWAQDVVAAALPSGWCLEGDQDQTMADGLTISIAPAGVREMPEWRHCVRKVQVPRLAVQGMDAEAAKAWIHNAVAQATATPKP